MGVLKAHWQMLLLVALVFALWRTPVALPLKLLVVLFHELSHGAAAVLTGGSIESLSVTPDQGGLALTRGGSRVAVLTAGYLGSLLIGLALFAVALRSTADRLVLAGLGALLLVVAALYIRDGFALVFCLACGGLMLAGARFLPRLAADLVLRVIGLASMIYVPWDILADTILRAGEGSDARLMAEEIGGATVIWGVLWLALSVAAIAFGLRFLSRGPSHLT